MILLINPPLVKPAEPPPGIARLYGTLRGEGAECVIIDANIEGILYLLGKDPPDSDRWTKRAVRNRARNLDLIRRMQGCDIERYKRAVADLNRLIGKSAENGFPVRLTLSDYRHRELSPVRSADLLRAAERFEDNPFHEYFSKRISHAMELHSPDAVGISLNYLSQALTALSIVGLIRARYGRVKILLGGSLVTSWVSNPQWKNPFSGLIDRIVSGPGEQALLDFAGIGKGARSAGFPMIRSRCTITWRPARLFPTAHLADATGTDARSARKKRKGSGTSRFHPKQRPEKQDNYAPGPRPALIHFVDSAISPAVLSELSKNPPGAPWYGFVRVTKRLADEDFCRALKLSGCAMLKLGLESGDQGVIDSEGKGIDLSVTSRALASLKRAGIGTYVYLLFGTPSESEDEARNTLDFTVRHAPFIDFLNLAIFNMPVSSADAKKFATSLHYEGDLSLYTGFSHPKGWDRAKVRRFLDREFKKHPAVAPILSNEPPFFTSNHAPFFCIGKIINRPR